MAEITASMVKELRERTDAPMMECKKALAEAGGAMAKAEEILRVKLGNKASKAASRVAAEGIVSVHLNAEATLATTQIPAGDYTKARLTATDAIVDLSATLNDR